MLNLALHRPSLQSSLLPPWSAGRTCEEDARGANNGQIYGHYGFHTASEPEPWWQVDLGDRFRLRAVALYNRRDMPHRLRRFSVLGSDDGRRWRVLARKADDTVFGADGAPLRIDLPGAPARFVRIRLDGTDFLHFCECQVYGEHPDPARQAQLVAGAEAAARRRAYIAPGRRGRVIDFAGLAVFVDDAAYHPQVIAALDDGYYEAPERAAVARLVAPADRVLEVGTAIGVVSMTAAQITGAEAVMTFDANPDIAADAADNFRRNGLDAIRGRVGLLKSRAAGAGDGETVPFHIDEQFWTSRLNATPDTPGIVRTVRIPVFCLEDAIAAHRATVLICDIEGGEVDLLRDADLSALRLIIMETHYWSAGELAIDRLVRRLVEAGFYPHLDHCQRHVIVLRRHPEP